MPIKNPMNLAIKLALESMRNGEVPVGCVITDSKNKIMAYICFLNEGHSHFQK